MRKVDEVDLKELKEVIAMLNGEADELKFKPIKTVGVKKEEMMKAFVDTCNDLADKNANVPDKVAEYFVWMTPVEEAEEKKAKSKKEEKNAPAKKEAEKKKAPAPAKKEEKKAPAKKEAEKKKAPAKEAKKAPAAPKKKNGESNTAKMLPLFESGKYSVAEVAAKLGGQPSSVRNHINSLKIKKGWKIEIVEGKITVKKRGKE